MARVSIEDCLDVLENRFALVSVAAARTRQLMSGEEPLVKTKNKFAVTALREIAEGQIVFSISKDLGELSRLRRDHKASLARSEAE